MWVPRVDVHGVWVKRKGTTTFGRIAYVTPHPEYMHFNIETEEFEFTKEPSHVHVVWENASEQSKFGLSAEYVFPETLEVLPVEPEPWYPHERKDAALAKKVLENGDVDRGLNPTI